MKFARRFRAELLEQGFPQHWVDSAVPYGQLKKVINKICLELNEYGLDIASFAQVLPVPDSEPQSGGYGIRKSSYDGAVTFQYDFAGNKEEFRPKLTLFFEDDRAVDAALSPDTKAFLQNRLAQQGHLGDVAENGNLGNIDEDPEPSKLAKQVSEPRSPGKDSTSMNGPVLRKVEIPLTFDAEFFELLHDDVSNLDAIQAEEQRSLNHDIADLSKEITTLVKPSRFSKTDMYAWRELFDLYLQAAVFFSTQEANTGTRNPTSAAKQLEWFQSEVTSRRLVDSFKLSASHRALDTFVKINVALLRHLRFQEINQVAIGKILKKFDKRTKLGVAKTAPKFIWVESLMPQTIAKAVCSQVTQDLIKITPQLDDYLCPICFTIAWRPIRLKCKHVFCVLCTIKMQKQRKRRCPLCRGNVIMDADEDAFDADFGKFLKKYFPKEIKSKQAELEIAAGEEKFGIYYTEASANNQCQVM